MDLLKVVSIVKKAPEDGLLITIGFMRHRRGKLKFVVEVSRWEEELLEDIIEAYSSTGVPMSQDGHDGDSELLRR